MGNIAELREHFGSAVRKRRNDLGVSQEQLAERAGLHRTYIADIERGARNPSLATIEKLATALEVSIAGLFSHVHRGHEVSEHADRGAAVDILLVEDNPDDVTLTLRAFQRARLGNRVQVATDGAEALDYIFCTGRHAGRRLEDRPRVILLDLGLPKMPGVEVLRRIRSDERTRSIPVVVLTVSEHERDIAECRRLRADAYIVKPVSFQRLSQVTPQLKFSWMLLKTGASAAP